MVVSYMRLLGRQFKSTLAPRLPSPPPPSLELKYIGEPTWSVSSLLPPPPPPLRSGPALAAESTTAVETGTEITPKKLHHLLRLAALSPPATAEGEAELLRSLHDHLHFVRAVQSVDTRGVPPLSRIESEVRREELTWEDVTAPHPKHLTAQGGQEWDPMALPKKTVGRFYVVDGKVTEEIDAENEGVPQGMA